MSNTRTAKGGQTMPPAFWFLVDAAKAFAIDPHDAKALIGEGAHVQDYQTFADKLDGAGYPELAERVYIEGVSW